MPEPLTQQLAARTLGVSLCQSCDGNVSERIARNGEEILYLCSPCFADWLVDLALHNERFALRQDGKNTFTVE